MAKTYRLGPARRAANMMMTVLIRTGVGAKSSYLLTTTGRRSGKPRTTPVTLVESGGQRCLVSPYGTVGWVHNVRANGAVSLRRGSRTEVLHPDGVDAQTAGPVLQQYVREVPITASFFDATADDRVSSFTDEAAQHPVFRLTAEAR
ncbi:MAG: nitroreductase family deazaflavin-dependent oxidoreductase [Antricoccus sp.]